MGSNHLYSLSWGEFGSSLASAAQLLRGHGELVDVTLAAGGRSFAAHKIVLCAASPFLLDLLKSTPCQHPVIMLAGIGADDLESLLEFVYRGEISVEPSQLPSLLQAAHCLNIHGLTPPTVLTENGEEIPLSAIPAASEALARDVINSYLPLRRRKRRTKSSSSSCKWPRTEDNHDTENRPLEGHNQDSRTTMEYERSKHDESGGNHGDETVNDRSEYSNHHGSRSPQPHHSTPISCEDSQGTANQDLPDSEPHLHTLMPMQQYSPLHIPSFPNSLNIGLPPSVPIPINSSTSGCTSVNAMMLGASKIRGASDCPGVCPLCGATLRQARNLRRHLLSSCKYRFNANSSQHSSSDPMIIEIKPEVEIPGYTGQSVNYGTDSGSSGCEQIECKPSPLPSSSPHGSLVSPHGSNMVSPRSNISSPTIAR
ncbi:broad-complex core protein isoforms 1/2/3/4/5-like isoform X2 [Diprion similis]|uniref:broad-complex core protein isoforms 1/2/3/4/5-like isoform X2 n=1 Tax=Diprion similis TaxID=362088 RepID=UPI001EF9B447|nr:broad-complex core protein isoforms 1/2/3/4/5-like isoform X2 [Diprion similis]